MPETYAAKTSKSSQLGLQLETFHFDVFILSKLQNFTNHIMGAAEMTEELSQCHINLLQNSSFSNSVV